MEFSRADIRAFNRGAQRAAEEGMTSEDLAGLEAHIVAQGGPLAEFMASPSPEAYERLFGVKPTPYGDGVMGDEIEGI